MFFIRVNINSYFGAQGAELLATKTFPSLFLEPNDRNSRGDVVLFIAQRAVRGGLVFSITQVPLPEERRKVVSLMGWKAQSLSQHHVIGKMPNSQ